MSELAELAKGCRGDTRERALRAKGIASQICYPGATHKAAAKLSTDVLSTETAPQVAATEFTTDMISAEATYVATSEATYVASAEATPTKATAAACIRRIDTEAAA
jgi:hypothetical protein